MHMQISHKIYSNFTGKLLHNQQLLFHKHLIYIEKVIENRFIRKLNISFNWIFIAALISFIPYYDFIFQILML